MTRCLKKNTYKVRVSFVFLMECKLKALIVYKWTSIEDSECASFSKLKKSTNCPIKPVKVNFQTTFRRTHLNINPSIGLLPRKGLLMDTGRKV